KSDQERMVGVWVIVNEDSGRKGVEWWISADQIYMNANQIGRPACRESERISSAERPKKINITDKKRNQEYDGVMNGTYTVDENDLCLGLGEIGKDRPAAFPDKRKRGDVLILQRATSGARPPKAKSDQERMIGAWVIVNEDSQQKGIEWWITADQIYMNAN